MIKKLLIIVAILILIATGLVMGAGFYGMNWLNSKELWVEVQRQTGQEISASSHTVEFFPEIRVAAKRLKYTDQVQVAQLEVVIPWSSVISRSPRVQVRVREPKVVHLGEEKGSQKPGQKKSPSQTNPVLWPAAINAASIDLKIESIHLPKVSGIQLEPFDFDFIAHASSTANQKVKVEIERLSALEVATQAKIEIDSSTRVGYLVRFLPESFVQGSVEGHFKSAEDFIANIDYQLSKRSIPLRLLPPVEVPERKITLAGDLIAQSRGKVKITPQAWDANLIYEVDLTGADLAMDQIHKPAKMPLVLRGGLISNPESIKVENGFAQLSNAQLNFSLVKEKITQITAELKPFEVASWLPIVKQVVQDPRMNSAQMSGVFSAKANLSLDQNNTPTGNVSLGMQNIVFNTAIVNSVAKSNEFKVKGDLHLNGQVQAQMQQGKVSSGGANLVSDFSRVAFWSKEGYQKRPAKLKSYVLQVQAQAQGGGVQVKRVHLKAPSRTEIELSGKVADLEKGMADLRLKNGQVSLGMLSKLGVQGLGTGNLSLSGSFVGSVFDALKSRSRLELTAREVNHPSGVKNAAAKILLDFNNQDTTIRLRSLSGRSQGIQMKGSGIVHYHLARKNLSGNLKIGVGALDIRPWEEQAEANSQKALAAAPKKEMSLEESKQAANQQMKGTQNQIGQLLMSNQVVDFKNSNFVLSVSSPKIQSKMMDFSRANLRLVVGGAKSKVKDQIILMAINGRALDGSVDLKTRYTRAGKISWSATTQKVSMPKLTQIMHKSNPQAKDKVWVFGQGDLRVTGTIDLNRGISSLQAKGNADIYNGGFKILPLPEESWKKIASQPQILRIFPALKNSKSGLNNSLEKAQAKFILAREVLNLEVVSQDQNLNLEAKGDVTLSGNCDLKGNFRLKDPLVGQKIGEANGDKPIPFISKGKNFDCGVKPDYGTIAKDLATHQAKKLASKKGAELKNKAKSKLEEQGKKLFKSIF